MRCHPPAHHRLHAEVSLLLTLMQELRLQAVKTQTPETPPCDFITLTALQPAAPEHPAPERGLFWCDVSHDLPRGKSLDPNCV